MIVLRCTRSRVARARVPGRASPGLRRPVRMSLASASASCTNIGEPRRGSSAAVSSSQFSIERDRTGPVEFEEGDLQGDPLADIHSRTFFVKETLMRMFTPLFMAVLLGCGTNGPQAPQATSEAVRHEESAPHNPMLFPKQARPYGQSIERWSELLWSYIYSIPVDQNPFFDTTGANCAVHQNGPVWFLPATPGSSLGTNVSRSCTIPHDRAIMMQLSSALNDFPCPDPNFHPAPGQS